MILCYDISTQISSRHKINCINNLSKSYYKSKSILKILLFYIFKFVFFMSKERNSDPIIHYDHVYPIYNTTPDANVSVIFVQIKEQQNLFHHSHSMTSIQSFFQL